MATKSHDGNLKERPNCEIEHRLVGVTSRHVGRMFVALFVMVESQF